MRSGNAYLPKHEGMRALESRELRLVYPSAPPVEGDRDVKAPLSRPSTRALPKTDLDEARWSVVSFNGVEAGGLTYDQAARLMEILGDNHIHGLCIITDAAALNVD